MEYIFDFIYENFFMTIYVLSLTILFSMFSEQNSIENNMLLNSKNVDTYLVTNGTLNEFEQNTKGSDVLSFVLNNKSDNVYINGAKWTYKDEYTVSDIRRININKDYKKETFALQSGKSGVYYNLID